jgi:sugar-specific transcriptional regulator TrmB
LSLEKVLKTLVSLGLTQMDAKVYVLLAKRGPIKATDAAKALKISKQRIYPIIKSLQSKGIVNSTLERPARFSAVPFEKVLDLFVKAKIEQAQRIQQNKDTLLSDWQFIAIGESASSPAKFTVIEGKSYVYSKIQQMLQETKSHMSFVATVPSLARADQFGLFDAAFNNPLRSKIRFRFLTELSERNVNAMKELLRKKPRADFNLEGRAPDLGLKLCSRMVIRDEEETLFFIDPVKDGFPREQDDVCLWTNCKSLVHAFIAMFEDLWRNATDIEDKILEIETGKPTPKTHVIHNAEAAHKKYHDALRSAKNEIIMITSSKGLVACWKSVNLVKEWSQKGVYLKLMAPITNENFEAAQQLLKCCEVRHVPTGYLGTTIIDGKHLFQFKNPPPEEENLQAIPYFENTFYTSDSEYVEKTKNMLENIWKSAHAPSAVTLESIIRRPAPTTAPPNPNFQKIAKKIKQVTFIEDAKGSKKITEKDVLHKVISARKIIAKDPLRDFSRMYATIAQAIIHPPDCFNLPDMMIYAFHIEKQSSFGEQDALNLYLWLKTPTGYGFVPVAVVHDHAETTPFWKAVMAGTPAGQNVQSVKKDELQIRIHGDTLFAGWTVPIPLFPAPYRLPPSCILFEGYGSAKAHTWTIIPPSGYRNELECNYLETFVTFMHPATKYEGPATEGFLYRDCIMDTYPP